MISNWMVYIFIVYVECSGDIYNKTPQAAGRDGYTTYIHTEIAPQRGTHKEPTRGSWGKSKNSRIKNQNHQWSTR
jgi:hypothetical protein